MKSNCNSIVMLALSLILTALKASAEGFVIPPPLSFNAGPLGSLNVSGVLSGYGFYQTNHYADSTGLLPSKSFGDSISNAFIIINKNKGIFQYTLQAGAYSLPGVGEPLQSATIAIKDFGILPIAYVTIAPTPDFSVSLGKMLTLIGYTGSFSYQRSNIEGGLLWDVEPTISRGAQVNYNSGPLSVSVSLNDGYYTKRYNYLDGLVTYEINGHNSVSLYAGGNLGHTGNIGAINGAHVYSSNAYVTSSLGLDNSSIIGLYYEYSIGNLSFDPEINYVYTHVNSSFGTAEISSMYGAALHFTYGFTNNLSLAGAFDYTTASRHGIDGTFLGYGSGANAYSIILTPTYTNNGYFIRGEMSYVRVNNFQVGSGFGRYGTKPDQFRALLETGFWF